MIRAWCPQRKSAARACSVDLGGSFPLGLRSSDRAPVEPSRFTEAYMMHGSTSPFYPVIACLDVATAMMDGPGRTALVRESIYFRKRIISLRRELAAKAAASHRGFSGLAARGG
jgi:arginine/lysine/ornithine decarboxylase